MDAGRGASVCAAAGFGASVSARDAEDAEGTAAASAIVIAGEDAGEDVVGSHEVEESHAAAELKGIDVSEHIVWISIGGEREYRLADLPQPLSEHLMSQVSPCLLNRRDGIVTCGGGAPQTCDLREYEPHPVGALRALPQFRQHSSETGILRLNEALQPERILLPPGPVI